MTPENQVELIAKICSGAKLLDESGQKVVLLPSMKFSAGGKKNTQDLLFVPFNHSGYESRLFFSEQINCDSAVNWTQHVLLNRPWWSPSYQVDTSISWKDQIFQHLVAVA